MKKISLTSHIKSIIALPFTVLVLIPFGLLISESGPQLFVDNTAWTFGLGIILLIAGSVLFVQSILLFIKIGMVLLLLGIRPKN